MARSVAAVTGAQLEVISHQENHLEAGLWSAGGPDVDRFLLLHASGGTTDVLLAERQQNGRYRITVVVVGVSGHGAGCGLDGGAALAGAGGVGRESFGSYCRG